MTLFRLSDVLRAMAIPIPILDVPLDFALFLLRLVSPSIVLLSAFLLLFTRRASTSQSPITSVIVETKTPRRAAILSLIFLVTLSYFLDGLTFIMYIVLYKKWEPNTGLEFGALLGVVAFGLTAIIGTWKDLRGVEVWSRKRLTLGVTLSAMIDIAQVVILAVTIKDIEADPPHIPEVPTPLPITISSLLHLVFPAFRVLVLIPLLWSLTHPRKTYTAVQSSSGTLPESSTGFTDTSLLLPPSESIPAPSTGLSPLSAAGAGSSKYGTFHSQATSTSGTETPATAGAPTPIQRKDEKKKDEIALDPSWSEMAQRVRRLTPYLWPSKSGSLQLLAFFCIILLIIGRLVNLAVPFTLGYLLKIFEHQSEDGVPSPKPESPWPWLFLYVGLRWLQGSGGISALRAVFWAPVMQYSDREMSQMCFEHLLNLSLAFHTRRKTGEVLRILDRGSAINHVFELILFSIFPTLVDIILALGALVVLFDLTLASVIFLAIVAYIVASVTLTTWRTKIRRQMNDRDVITRGIHTDCLLNWETVKYFNGEMYESERYRNAIGDYQALEYKVMISLNFLNIIQNLIIMAGLLVGSMIIAMRITEGKSESSDFIVFITYLTQLYAPLNQLGFIYRSFNQSLVDTERLMKLLDEPTEVRDQPGAPQLIVEAGEIEFQNVSFSYDGRVSALKNVSFKIPRGGSVALVGESGSGKSTLLRLLYRFYDLKEGEGRILVDGQDIRGVTQQSLRGAIGVVPQDAVLFNGTIGHNIQYGKIGASQEEVEAAAKAAQLHERVLTFPDEYETKVGERGVRLSGGEKQRVAIARTLLKNPPILLMDEATSALDTQTEREIQKALHNLVQGRSSLSIAHRLSTIASANLILVLKDGEIIEQGSHSQLLAQNGVFAAMWADQITAEEATLPGGVTGTDISVQKEAPIHEDVAGYSVEPTEDAQASEAPAAESAEPAEADAGIFFGTEAQTESPPAAELELPASEGDVRSSELATREDIAEPEAPPAESAAPFSFPVSESVPIAFPAGDDRASQTGSVREAATSPGVTFAPGSPSPRTGTPDPDSEPKRKRISSQNFQRLARRITVMNPRRQNSSSSAPAAPSPPRSSREGTSGSLDEGRPLPQRESSSATLDGPSAGASDVSKKDKKKEKKRMTFL